MKNRWIEILANVLFWALTSWLITSFFSIETQEFEIINGKETIKITRSGPLINFLLLGQFIAFLFFYAHLYDILLSAKRDKLRRIWLRSPALLIFFFGIYYLLATLFIVPDSFAFPPIAIGIFIFYYAVSFGYGFTKIWIKNEQDKKELELVKNQAELNLLRSQLHPHFLFNTLNNLLSMVDQQQNPELAESIGKLSSLLRYVVYDTQHTKVTVAKEINFIQTFAQLNLLRFEEGEIDFKLDIHGLHDQQPIEPGILLCFIENAFKHGVRPETPSFVHINLDISNENSIFFEIKNAIPPQFANEKNTGGQGLKSTIERLELVYPNRHHLSINSQNGIYSVNLKLY